MLKIKEDITSAGHGSFTYSFEKPEIALKRILATICREQKPASLSIPGILGSPHDILCDIVN